MDRPKVKTVVTKGKKWKELQSRRSFRSVNIVHSPDQYNQTSFIHDPPGVWQNAKEKNTEMFDDKRALIEENPKESFAFDEEYRKCGFDLHKDETQKSSDLCEEEEEDDDDDEDDEEEEEKKHDHGKKAVRWVDEDEKNRMDLGISETEKSKRLENLMERRRLRKLSTFQVRKAGPGNISCDPVLSVNIPKINPFLAKTKTSYDSSSDVPGSAPSYVVKSNPFDLPYDPHEEKPILTEDGFQEDSVLNRLKEPVFRSNEKFSLALPPKLSTCGSDFAIKQLSCGKLVTTTIENKEDDNKQPQQDRSISNDTEEPKSAEKVVDVVSIPHETTDTEPAKKTADAASVPDETTEPAEKTVDTVSNPDEKIKTEPAEKAVNTVSIPDEKTETEPTEKTVDTVSIPDEKTETEPYVKEQLSDKSSSSSLSSSSEDERILRPNKEAILHSLSMSRMRLAAAANNLRRNAESFDCGPSALFDKSKTDSCFFSGNKRLHYTSTCSMASDMQVEVSERGSLDGTSMVNSTEPSEMDGNEVRLRDIDEENEQESWKTRFSRPVFDQDSIGSNMEPENIDFGRFKLPNPDPKYRIWRSISSSKVLSHTNISFDLSDNESEGSNSDMDENFDQNPTIDQGSESKFVGEMGFEIRESIDPIESLDQPLPPTEDDCLQNDR